MKGAQHATHTCNTNPKLEKMGLFRHPRWCYLKKLKDPPTWLQVTTTLKDLNLHPLANREQFMIYMIMIYVSSNNIQ